MDPAEAKLLRASPALSDGFLLEVLQDLVRTPSVNPGIYEAAMVARVQAWAEGTGASVHPVEMFDGRYSVAVVLEGAHDGPRLVLNGHMDTVPIDAGERWDSGPYDAEVRDGSVYGRGACDMKAGLTVQIGVLHHLARHVRDMRGALVLHFAAGEECAEPGTLKMIEAGFTGDWGIVTEPTSLRVATAERGIGYYTVTIPGRSIHASRSHLGLNPLQRVPAVLEALFDYDRDARKKPHPLLPGGSCTPTVINAGVKENAVADRCTILLDRRLLPGETVDGELEEIRRRLAPISSALPDAPIEVTRFRWSFQPAEIPSDSPFALRVCDTFSAVTGRETEIYGTPFASDVHNLVNDAGMEAITFGPGNVEECHCANERLELSQLRDAALVTARVAEDLLLRGDS
jgi:succinyl-diaminopimelate desuccinylase